MADYVSKYTGSQVDGILDEAIELPVIDNADRDDGKVLTYSAESGIIWANAQSNINTDSATDGSFLKYSNSSGTFWGGIFGDELPYDVGNSTISIGSVLKVTDVSSSLHAVWGSPDNGLPSTSGASNGQVLQYNSSTDTIDWTDIFPDSQNVYGDNYYLKYTSNGLIWDEPIPEATSLNDNQYLKYDYYNGLVWDTPIPDTSGIDSDYFLRYDSNNGLAWDMPLPSTTGKTSGFLTVIDNGNSIDWVTFSELEYYGYYQLPDLPSEGNYILVSNNGVLEWELQN